MNAESHFDNRASEQDYLDMISREGWGDCAYLMMLDDEERDMFDTDEQAVIFTVNSDGIKGVQWFPTPAAAMANFEDYRAEYESED